MSRFIDHLPELCRLDLNAAQYHEYIAQHMQQNGWAVTREAIVRAKLVLESGRVLSSGKIDLVVEKNGYTIAIELDQLSPREKSIAKLAAYPCQQAWVLCRNGQATRIK